MPHIKNGLKIEDYEEQHMITLKTKEIMAMKRIKKLSVLISTTMVLISFITLFGACSSPTDIDEPEQVSEKLKERGYSQKEIESICYQNLFRFIKRNLR